MNHLIAALITRRITTLITEDKLTEPVRNMWLKKHPTTTLTGYVVTCPNCVSVWAGLTTLLLLPLAKHRVVRLLGGALALSEITILINAVTVDHTNSFTM